MLFSAFAERKQVETILTVANTIEYWTSALQIEQTDARSAQAYDHLLRSWGKFTLSDIVVVNRDGSVFDSTNGIKDVPKSLLNCIETDRIETHRTDFNGYYGDEVLTVSFPMHYKDNVIGAILFNKEISDIRHMVLEMLMLFLLSSSVSILFAFILVYFQAKNISAPIVKINKAAQMIAAGNFNERVDITTNDEIGQLASTFNFMASSIEKAETNRQQFISDVSHELRTPMTSISGFVRGMLDGTITDDIRDDYLKIVLNESVRLTKLVNDMLEMSKMQSDGFKLDMKEFDITELICVCLINLDNKIREHKLEVELDFRPEELTTIADKDQIQRVLINLIDNAVKFSYPNTVININTWIENGKAHISISNTGDGISEEDQKSVFDRFYKTDKSRTNDKKGAGLGLSLVKNIIRLHNQQITVKSVPNSDGNGRITTFEFTLEVK